MIMLPSHADQCRCRVHQPFKNSHIEFNITCTCSAVGDVLRWQMLNSTTVITSFFSDDVNVIRQKVIDGVRYTAELHQVSPVTTIEYHYVSTLNVSSSLDIMAVSIACGSTGVSIPCTLEQPVVTSKPEKGTVM